MWERACSRWRPDSHHQSEYQPDDKKRRFHQRQKRQRHVPQRKSVHEQGDQDDDRDRYAEKEQQ
jgi:hypothetical protein